MRIRTLSIAVLLLVLFSVAPALAQDNLVGLDTFPNAFGISIGTAPDYLGSDDYRFGVIPFGRISFANHRFVTLTGTFIHANLLNHPNLRLGPMVNFRFGRSDVEDDAVDNMEDIDPAFEAGVNAGVEFFNPRDPRKRFGLGANFVHDLTGEHEGYLFSMNVRGWFPPARFLTLGLATGFSYGSGNYTSTYFSVTPSDAARSGLPAFDADAGLRDVKVVAMAIVHLSRSWHINVGMLYSRLLSDAADSPIVDDRGSADQFLAGAGVVYVWGLNRRS